MKSIVILEKDRYLIETYIKRLESQHYTVFILDPQDKALLKSIAKQDPILILLNTEIFDESARKIVINIKKSKETNAIPLIVVSGISTEQDVLDALHLGADDYWIKSSFIQSGVTEVVQSFLEKHQSSPAQKESSMTEKLQERAKEIFSRAQEEKNRIIRYVDSIRRERDRKVEYRQCVHCGGPVYPEESICKYCGNPVALS